MFFIASLREFGFATSAPSLLIAASTLAASGPLITIRTYTPSIVVVTAVVVTVVVVTVVVLVVSKFG